MELRKVTSKDVWQAVLQHRIPKWPITERVGTVPTVAFHTIVFIFSFTLSLSLSVYAYAYMFVLVNVCVNSFNEGVNGILFFSNFLYQPHKAKFELFNTHYNGLLFGKLAKIELDIAYGKQTSFNRIYLSRY